MNLKKIIIFYPSFERGGVELILINLMNFFFKKKINVCLISSNFNNKKIQKNKFFEYRNVKSSSINLINNRISKSFFALKILLYEMKNSNNKNTLVFSLQSSSLSIILSKFLKFKIVVRNAEDPIYSTFHKENKIIAFFVLILKIFTYNFASGIITNSKGSKISLGKILLKNVYLNYIYNPYLKKIYKKNTTKRKKYVLAVGRLTKQKNFGSLLTAFSLISKKVSNYNLIIVGDGELKKELYDLKNKLNLNKRVIFTGWKKNIDYYYKNASLFILPSLYEGLGNVVIDAVNHEIPTIVTDCKSGPSEIILNNKGGYVVPKEDSEILGKKILYVLNNYSKAKKKIYYAKKKIYRFSRDRNSKKYLNILQKVIDG